MKLAFPPGSDVVADYSPAEREIMRQFAHAAKRGSIRRAQMMRELQVIHDAKVLLGATVRDV